MTLVYVHIGKNNLPNHLFHSIFQVCLFNPKLIMYIVLDNTLVDTFWIKYNALDIQNTPILNIICINELRLSSQVKECMHKLNTLDSFWQNTLFRFFYIHALINAYLLEQVFHIENDIMIYESFTDILATLDTTRMYIVQDSPNRVVPSIVYIPSLALIQAFVDFVVKYYQQNHIFINDMNLLSMFANENSSVYNLPFIPFEKNKVIFDGASIGQYIGGIDCRNDPTFKNETFKEKLRIFHKTAGFINETCIMKPNIYTFYRKKIILDKNELFIPIVTNNQGVVNTIANIHVHSKLMFMFSSIFDIEMDDFITGDSVLSLCHYTITTPQIFNFHQNFNVFAKDTIVVRDFNNVNIPDFNKFMLEYDEKVIKLFIYTHILDDFITFILPFLDRSRKYIIYTHNSDHEFNEKYIKLLESPLVLHVYAQNLNIVSDKCSLLPIGIANSMWPHGNLLKIFKVMTETYHLKKTFGLHVNINTSTFYYRKNVLDFCTNNNIHIAHKMSFDDYLYDLSTHRFCLAIRGNGIDTHRFWEALYLGVIPVVINNEYTKCNAFVQNLKINDIPFVEITNLNQLLQHKFDQSQYHKILGYNHILTRKFLKIHNYN